MRIEKLRQTFEIDTVLVHFPLHPETPAEGRSMAELYAGRNVDPEAMYQRMKGLMDAEGLPYGRRTHTYNSRLAQELGKWADTQPGDPWGRVHEHWADTDVLNAAVPANLWGRGELNGPWGDPIPHRFMNHAVR